MGMVGNLGVQSYCFRGFKENRQVADMVRQCGLSRIELCNVHADFTNEACFEAVLEVYRQAGVDIVSIGVQAFRNDELTEARFFDFAKRAGAKVITADFALDTVPDSFKTAERLADRYDVRVAIHNHGGRHWLGSSAVLAKVFAHTGPRIGLGLDTAWALDSGEDPLAMAERFGDRLYALHLKDFVFDRARKPMDVIVGEGNLDLRGLLALLGDIGFDGPAVLEYEGDVEDPLPAIQKCAAAVKREA